MAAAGWTAVEARGTALVLAGDSWQVVSPGDAIAPDPVLRTLRSGAMRLVNGADSIEVMPNTAIGISEGEGGTVVIEQYSGRIVIAAGADDGGRYRITTPELVLNLSQGMLSVEVEGHASHVRVVRGTATATDRQTGRPVALTPNQTLSVGAPFSAPNAGPALSNANNSPGSANRGHGNGASNGHGNSSGNAGSNGNAGGNGGGNGGSQGGGGSSGNGSSSSHGSSSSSSGRGNGR